MDSNNIFIGTSGWSYKHWKGIFYPDSLPQSKWMNFFITKYTTVEINNSFYKLPEEQTFINWQKAVPDNFIFSVKANRFITHIKRLSNVEDILFLFLERVKLLKDNLGVILFQLPPTFKVNLEKLNGFLMLLPKQFKYTFEFRNPDWWIQDTFDLLRNFNAAFCIYEMPGMITPREVTSDIVYIRFHSPFDRNLKQFEMPLLMNWAEFILNCSSNGKKIYCYFNNDWFGYAIQDSEMLQEIINSNIYING